jgi:hypothetical protein
MPGRIDGYRDSLAVSAAVLPLWKVMLRASMEKLKPKVK